MQAYIHAPNGIPSFISSVRTVEDSTFLDRVVILIGWLALHSLSHSSLSAAVLA
jgi:hypothetical protein